MAALHRNFYTGDWVWPAYIKIILGKVHLELKYTTAGFKSGPKTPFLLIVYKRFLYNNVRRIYISLCCTYIVSNMITSTPIRNRKTFFFDAWYEEGIAKRYTHTIYCSKRDPSYRHFWDLLIVCDSYSTQYIKMFNEGRHTVCAFITDRAFCNCQIQFCPNFFLSVTRLCLS